MHISGSGQRDAGQEDKPQDDRGGAKQDREGERATEQVTEGPKPEDDAATKGNDPG